jgi:hypothetical protein
MNAFRRELLPVHGLVQLIFGTVPQISRLTEYQQAWRFRLQRSRRMLALSEHSATAPHHPLHRNVTRYVVACEPAMQSVFLYATRPPRR